MPLRTKGTNSHLSLSSLLRVFKLTNWLKLQPLTNQHQMCPENFILPSSPLLIWIAYNEIPHMSLSKKLKDPYTKALPLNSFVTSTPSMLVALTYI